MALSGALDGASRFVWIAQAASVFLLVVGLLDSSELTVRHKESLDRTKAADRLARDVFDLASDIQEALRHEAPAGGTGVPAVAQLVRNVADARAAVDALSLAIARDRGIGTDRRIALNEPLRRMRAVLWLNVEPSEQPGPLSTIHPDEPAMPLTVLPNLGLIRPTAALEELRISELCLLAFYASARPANILALIGDAEPWRQELAQQRHEDLLHRVEGAAEKAVTGYWQRVRRDAVGVYQRWQAYSDDSDPAEGALIALATPTSLHQVLVARFRDLEAIEDRLAGRTAIGLPGLDQPVPLATALHFGPLLLAVWLIGSCLYLWSAAAWVERDPGRVLAADLSTPMPLVWYPKPIASALGLISFCLCVVMALLPPAAMLSAGLWSPVLEAAGDVQVRVAFWAGMAVLTGVAALWLISVVVVNDRLGRVVDGSHRRGRSFDGRGFALRRRARSRPAE